MQTGEPVLARVGGAAVFGEMRPEMASRVNETMIAFYGREPAAVAEAYDFSGIRTLVDIGGGSGNLITTLLLANPALRGIVYDLPHAGPDARRMIEARGVADRCEVIGGSFFESVPGGADAYLLSHVINDWPEERCLAILRNVRRAVPPGGRLLVVEQVITPGGESGRAKLLDLISLATTAGMHRRPDEHRELMARAGFRMTRLVATREPVSIIEGEPV
ncbi:MAG TPA: methyltransferase [Longimicrobiaceae bacterium]|nr:methyltransferase [Longimicrobiaceae bacterium]